MLRKIINVKWLRWILSGFLIANVYRETGFYTAFSLALIFLACEFLSVWMKNVAETLNFVTDLIKIWGGK